MASSNILTGAAGVHYVAFVASKMGYAVGLTAPGVEGVDLMISNPTTGRAISIQVKTSRDAFNERPRKKDPFWMWRASKKTNEIAEKPGNEIFFALVNLNPEAELLDDKQEDKLPDADVFIVHPRDTRKLLAKFPLNNPTDFWITIEKDKEHDYKNYKNCWKLIKGALEKVA